MRTKQRREREAFPLFAEQIAMEQPCEDEVMQRRATRWAESEVNTRAWRAARWREARRRLRAMSDNEWRVLTEAWNGAPYPADATYLLDFLHAFSVGRFTLDTIPFHVVPRDRYGRRLSALDQQAEMQLTGR